ncbi:tRNA pseudouridine(38-40) synthase TruA [[Mycoplasma] cavipharyngis]|uniref:tRNA pseudouridine(38-40) synthase TruA n=1 Tax=[Mycoplasma] cavipharyngis TaxID=92757 RepID=UPI0037049976
MNLKSVDQWETFKIDLSYHGVLFSGYAIQPAPLRTVQAELEKILSYLFQAKIKLIASGRTDAKAHALHQVCSFRVINYHHITATTIYHYLIKNVSEDIYIIAVSKVKNDFHAQLSVKSKTYLYIIQKKFDLTQVHLSYYCDQVIDIDKLKQCLNLFLGTHDFYSFTNTDQKQNTIRTINFIKLQETKKQIKILINGSGFMRYMVRMLLGVALKYATNKISWSFVIDKLSNPKKGSAIYKLPASGLFLKKIYY